MRFKYYLRGCGVGIIFTALILIIGFHRNKNIGMTDEEIRKRASEMGMVMSESLEPSVDTQAEIDPVKEALAGAQASGTDAAKKPKTSTQAGGADDAPNPAGADGTQKADQSDGALDDAGTAGEDGTQDGGQPDRTDIPVDGDGESRTVTIKVKRGDVCRVIAEKLYKHGLIADVDEFRHFMQDNGYDNLIQTGTFTFHSGMEYQEIADVLTYKE